MYLITVATGAILVTWFITLLAQLAFRRKHKAETIEFKLRFYPYSNLFAIFMLCMIMVIMMHMDDMKWSVYITPFWITLLTVIYLFRRNHRGETTLQSQSQD